jgi:hypothetical protein
LEMCSAPAFSRSTKFSTFSCKSKGQAAVRRSLAQPLDY